VVKVKNLVRDRESGVRRGVFKGVEDGRRPPALRAPETAI
jgi:hypothetical protein